MRHKYRNDVAKIYLRIFNLLNELGISINCFYPHLRMYFEKSNLTYPDEDVIFVTPIVF